MGYDRGKRYTLKNYPEWGIIPSDRSEFDEENSTLAFYLFINKKVEKIPDYEEWNGFGIYRLSDESSELDVIKAFEKEIKGFFVAHNIYLSHDILEEITIENEL